MARKKTTAIPEVDIIKSGINRKDPFETLRDDDGYITMTRTKASKDARKEVVVERIKKQEELLKKARKEAEDIVDEDDIKKISKKIKNKKKKNKKEDKKNKKGKKKNESYADSLLESVPSDLAEFIKGGGNKGVKKKKKKEKKKKKQREELGVVVKEKKKKKAPAKKGKDDDKKSKEKSEVAERFKEVEKITRENIKEIDATMEIVDKRIKELTSSSERVRGKDTALANYFAAKTSLISTKQKAATDILSSRAKVYDIEMKKERSAASAASTDADVLARIFPGISMSANMDTAVKDHISKNGKNKEGKKKKKEKDYDAEVLMKKTKELKKSGKIEFSEWDENIEWEGKYNVAIKKAWTDGEWKFIAVDDDGNVMRDVPKSMLPSKKRVQMQFDDEKDVAIDKNTNTIYQVLQVPSI